MVILDTCHSGGHTAVTKDGGTKKLGTEDRKHVKGLLEIGVGTKDNPKSHFLQSAMLRAKSIGQKDAAVLASSTAKQVSFERREKDLSVMTYYLVDLIAKGDHGLTLKQAFDGISTKVKGYVEKNFEGTTQTPVFTDQAVATPALLKP
jgi:hypothetical protein